MPACSRSAQPGVRRLKAVTFDMTPRDTLIEDRREQRRSGSLRLLVFSQDTLATHPLPQRGTLIIGRHEDADVRIDVPYISRKHAAIHVDGESVRIEDLGSSNGTRVKERVLRRGEDEALAPGDVVELGAST